MRSRLSYASWRLEGARPPKRLEQSTADQLNQVSLVIIKSPGELISCIDQSMD